MPPTSKNGKTPLSCRITEHLVRFAKKHGGGNLTAGVEDILAEAYARHTALRADHAATSDPAVA